MDRHAILGKTAMDLKRESALEVHEIERQLLAKPGVKSFTQVRRSEQGEIRYHAVTKASICDEQGAVTGFITTFIETTDLKAAKIKAEEKLRLTSAILESSPAPTMVMDRERRITYYYDT